MYKIIVFRLTNILTNCKISKVYWYLFYKLVIICTPYNYVSLECGVFFCVYLSVKYITINKNTIMVLTPLFFTFYYS